MKNYLNKSLSGLFLRQFLDFWYFYIGAIACLYGTHWIQSHLPFLAKELADIVETGTEKVEVGKFFVLALGIIIFRTSSRLLFFYPARVLQKNLRVELLHKLESVSPSRYKHHSDGQLFQVMQMDMEQLRALIGFALLQLGNIVVAMVVLIPKMMSFNENLIYALNPLLVAFILFTLFVSYNKKYYKIVQDLQGEVQNIILETYAGKKTIKNYHSEESFVEWFQRISKLELGYFYKAGVGIGVSLPLLPLGMGLSLIWGGHIIFQENLGASSLILFSGFIFLFMEPILFLSWIGIVFARSYGSWQRIKNLVKDLSIQSTTEKELLQKNKNFPEKNLDFNLPFWGNDLIFNFPRGKWTVLIGKTGCGKSTVLTNVADVLMEKGMEISYVSQDPYLYNDTIRNNIFLGQEQTSEKLSQAYELLCLFGLEDLASNKDSLFEIEVGEKGKRLSGGQVKRLSLVRSMMAEAEIIIWDDPFSSVDLILEKKIISDLKRFVLLQGKTIILSSHRLTTVRSSDHCIYLDREKGIVESGEVDSLLNPQSETYEYFKQQMV